MSSSVEQIKERLDIVAVVGSYMKLERAGSNFRARCPFHNEKTPSFMVSPDRGTYHCFGCNQGGDIFSFVEAIEGTDFPGALRILADRAGVVLTHDNPSERNERDRLYQLLADATLFYRRELRKNSDALEYLKKRGLKGETIDDFQIGFAPNEWHALEEYLTGKGYKPDELEKTGMSIRSEKPGSEGRYYDRFRSRIMFPLCDSSGRVVGFSGRVFQSDDPAKYVNSPQTTLYDKSKILFGLSQAKSAIREKGVAILVEGQMDLVMAHQAGTTNSVAVSGTALTPFHLELLKRFADKLLFSFDSDDAGLSAAKRSAIPALAAGFDVHAIELSGEKDPADLILESPEKWLAAVAGAKHIVEFFLSVLQKRSKDKREFRMNVEKNVLPILANIESRIDQSHFIDIVSAFLDVPRDAVTEEMRKVPVGVSDMPTVHYIEPAHARGPVSRKETLERKVQGIIWWKPELSELAGKYEEIAGGKRTIFTEDQKNALVFEAEAFYGGTETLDGHIADLLREFEKEILKDELTGAMSELRRAEMLHDSEKSVEMLARCQTLSGKLNKLNIFETKA